jgi:hypothetical protein
MEYPQIKAHLINEKKVKKILFFLIKKYICNLILRDVAQPGSVLAWGARGRWFESSHPDKS